MRYISALIAGLVGLSIIATPASAHHKSDHQGGSASTARSRSGENEPKKAPGISQSKKHQNGDEDGLVTASQGLHLGQRVHGMTSDQATELSNELANCISPDEIKAMKLGEIKRLAHAAGVSTAELKDQLVSDDGHTGGLGRLWHAGIEDAEANALHELLEEGLEAEDLQALSVGKILQAARACGISPVELVDLLDEN